MLFAVLPLAVVVKLMLDARAADGGARRRVHTRLRAYLPLVAIYVVGALGYVLFQAARGVRLSGASVRIGRHDGPLLARDVAELDVEHAAELGLAVAIFPAQRAIVLLVLAVGRGSRCAAERAFLAVATSAVVLVVVQVAPLRRGSRSESRSATCSSSSPPLHGAGAVARPRLAEAGRHDGGRDRRAPVSLLLDLPLEKRLNVSITSDTFGFIPLLRLSYHYSIPTVRWLMIAGAVVAQPWRSPSSRAASRGSSFPRASRSTSR